MNTEKFSLVKVNEMFEAEARYNQKGQLVVEPLQAIEYVKKYFFPIETGNHFYWNGQSFENRSKDSVKDTFFNRMHKSISEWYFTKYYQIFNVVCDINKPVIDGSTLNLISGFPHKPKAMTEYSSETKQRMQLLLDYILEVLANCNQSEYTYLLKWVACVCKGKKNTSLLYLKGVEGIGKSTLAVFLREYVLNEKIAIKVSDTSCLLTSFNQCLAGKILVVFEELPTMSTGQWCMAGSKLKDMVTDKTTQYSDKFEKQYTSNNQSNYIIITNEEAFRESEGRRVYICNISTKRLADHKYFDELYGKCFNLEVGECFFSYMQTIDISNFDAQRDMPFTEKKSDAISKRLHNVYEFLKMEYIKNKKGIKALKLSDLYDKYTECHFDSKLKKIEFKNKLTEINIEVKKSDGYLKVYATYDYLLQIALKQHWIHDVDEIEYDQNISVDKPNKKVVTSLPNIEIEELRDENKKLKQKLARLEQKLNELDPEVMPDIKPQVPLIKQAVVYMFDDAENTTAQTTDTVAKKTKTKTKIIKPKLSIVHDNKSDDELETYDILLSKCDKLI